MALCVDVLVDRVDGSFDILGITIQRTSQQPQLRLGDLGNG